MSAALLQLNEFCVSYGAVQAVHGPTLEAALSRTSWPSLADNLTGSALLFLSTTIT